MPLQNLSTAINKLKLFEDCLIFELFPATHMPSKTLNVGIDL